ncbi:hypothetical protein BD560DRAFT_448196 [Blakeslea trispora]|nr:hypothetical protein BD560DRAFT_448196 [Blakeslea trispora]
MTARPKRVTLDMALLYPHQLRDDQVEREGLMLFLVHNYEGSITLVLLTKQLWDDHFLHFNRHEPYQTHGARVKIRGLCHRNFRNFSRNSRVLVYPVHVTHIEVRDCTTIIPRTVRYRQHDFEEVLDLRYDGVQLANQTDETGYESTGSSNSSSSTSSCYFTAPESPEEHLALSVPPDAVMAAVSRNSAARILMANLSRSSETGPRIRTGNISMASSVASGSQLSARIDTSTQAGPSSRFGSHGNTRSVLLAHRSSSMDTFLLSEEDSSSSDSSSSYDDYNEPESSSSAQLRLIRRKNKKGKSRAIAKPRSNAKSIKIATPKGKTKAEPKSLGKTFVDYVPHFFGMRCLMPGEEEAVLDQEASRVEGSELTAPTVVSNQESNRAEGSGTSASTHAEDTSDAKKPTRKRKRKLYSNEADDDQSKVTEDTCLRRSARLAEKKMRYTK